MRSVRVRQTLSSIFQARSGLPENITLVSGFFGNPVRPNYVPGQNVYVPHVNWVTQKGSYNSAAFVVPPAYDGTWGENASDPVIESVGLILDGAAISPGDKQVEFDHAAAASIHASLRSGQRRRGDEVDSDCGAAGASAEFSLNMCDARLFTSE